MFGADAAFDPVHGVYLVVMDKEPRDTPRRLVGVFVDRAGNAIGSEFLIAVPDGDFPRVVYSPQVSNGAGGIGGFLVIWADWGHDAIYARRVAYPGVVVGDASAVGAGYGVAESAYSTASPEFVDVWVNDTLPHSVSIGRVSLSGVLLEPPTILASGNAGRSAVYWNSSTEVSWHEVRHEFGILYAMRASYWAVRFARMNAAGLILDDREVATTDAAPSAAALAFSPLTGNYVALWADAGTGRITGAELSPEGEVLQTGPLPASIVGGQSGMALSYNQSSGTFLLVGFGHKMLTFEQVRGLELNKYGAPNSPVIEVTAAPMTGNLYAPRVVAPGDAPEWLLHVGAAPHYVQFVSTSSVAGGSEMRLNGCYGLDPFEALGGGTCSNGEWLPPADPPGGDPPAPPAPAPTGSCATPDPFVGLGGGTCYNGGWLPPGMPVPNTPAPTPVTPPAPAPTGSCATPDPFVGLGGGTCYNGGWLPPGMPVPNTPAPTPVTPPAPASTGSCATPDPFVALGGGTCYNGGWLPPGMPVPNAPASPAAPVSGTCVTPDPFLDLPELVGECRSGGWVPIPAITVTGTLSRRVDLGNGWVVVTGGGTYILLGDLPQAVQSDGLSVLVKGTLGTGVAAVWPTLQVYTIAVR